MAKLKGAKKAEFVARMAKGRKKAARKKPAAKKKATGSRAKSTGKKAVKKAPNRGQLRGAAKAEFLRRMARGRKAASRGGTKNKPKRARRNSEMTDAERTYEQFHQKPPGSVLDITQQYHYPSVFAELGTLKELRFDLDSANRDFPLTHFKGTRVVCTPDGSNLYFLEGDMTVDLAALDIASDKDFVELGPCPYIMYHTQKGFHDFAPMDYYHRFGEEDGIVPNLVYDRLNRALFLVSGNYQVKPEGIVN